MRLLKDAFKNCNESKNSILFLIVKLINFSIVLGIGLIFLILSLCNSLKIIWPSYPSRLWHITGNLFDIFNFELHSLWAGLLYFPVTWQWSITLSLVIFFSTYPTFIRFFILFFIFWWHIYFFSKSIFNNFTAILFLSKNPFEKIFNTIVTFKKFNWLGILIISTILQLYNLECFLDIVYYVYLFFL